MDKLIADVQTETAKEIVPEVETKQAEKSDIIVSQKPPEESAYVQSFEGITIADIKREEEKKRLAEFEKEKDKLIEEQYVPVELKQEEKKEEQIVTQVESQNIIEKPNYDLIEEPKKVIRLRGRSAVKSERGKTKKLAGVLLACVLGASSIVTIANFTILDNLSSSISEIGKQYNIRFEKYMKDIANLDITKKNMEFLDTYPDELQPAGSLGQKTNWFDRLCSFIAGLFGG